MALLDREKRLHMLLSDGEDSMLRALAEDTGLSVSDYVRQLIRSAFLQRWPGKAKR